MTYITIQAQENKLRALTASALWWYNYFIIYHSVIIIEIKCTINVMHLNHPQTIHPPTASWPLGKLSYVELVPGAKGGWGLLG